MSDDTEDVLAGLPESIVLWQDETHWVIRHEQSGVTTQGTSRLEALLMLVDALAGYEGVPLTEVQDLADEVFTPSEELNDLDGPDPE